VPVKNIKINKHSKTSERFSANQWSRTMSQKERILQHLESGNTITSLEAYQELGITQLAARIFELKAEGIPILSEQIKVTNRFDEECTVSRYFLMGA
jgi:hypothetical protein